MMGYIYITLMIVLTTAGQLLTKKGSESLTPGGPLYVRLKALCNRYVILAAVLTLAAPVFYILALKELPLSVAFAFTGLNYILVGLGGKMFFHEPLNHFHYLGMASLFLGITVFHL